MAYRKRIHKVDAFNYYHSHLALYPDNFYGVVVRDDNMCIQFHPTTIKTIKGNTILHKDLTGTDNMRVCTNGTDIENIGLRVKYDQLADMLLAIVDGLASKKDEHLDLLKILNGEISRLITKIEGRI